MLRQSSIVAARFGAAAILIAGLACGPTTAEPGGTAGTSAAGTGGATGGTSPAGAAGSTASGTAGTTAGAGGNSGVAGMATGGAAGAAGATGTAGSAGAAGSAPAGRGGNAGGGGTGGNASAGRGGSSAGSGGRGGSSAGGAAGSGTGGSGGSSTGTATFTVQVQLASAMNAPAPGTIGIVTWTVNVSVADRGAHRLRPRHQLRHDRARRSRARRPPHAAARHEAGEDVSLPRRRARRLGDVHEQRLHRDDRTRHDDGVDLEIPGHERDREQARLHHHVVLAGHRPHRAVHPRRRRRDRLVGPRRPSGGIARARMSADGKNMWMTSASNTGQPDPAPQHGRAGRADVLERRRLARPDRRQRRHDGVPRVRRVRLQQHLRDRSQRHQEGDLRIAGRRPARPAVTATRSATRRRRTSTRSPTSARTCTSSTAPVRCSGSCRSKVASGHTAWGGIQHGHQLLDASIIIFANNGGGTNMSAMIEYDLNGQQLKTLRPRRLLRRTWATSSGCPAATRWSTSRTRR